MRPALDAGHGMHNRAYGVFDPGACAADVREVDYNQEIVKNTALILRRAGVRDILVLSSGHVWERDDRAAHWGATHYLAVHCDASASSAARGTSVWINTGDPHRVRTDAAKLGEAVARALGIPWRGVAEKDFAVLQGRQPDMLLETFFVTSPKDRAAYRLYGDRCHEAIASFMLDWGKVTVSANVRYDAPYWWVLLTLPAAAKERFAAAVLEECRAGGFQLAGPASTAIIGIQVGDSTRETAVKLVARFGGEVIRIVRSDMRDNKPDNSIRLVNRSYYVKED